MDALKVKKTKLDVAKEIMGYALIVVTWLSTFIILAALS